MAPSCRWLVVARRIVRVMLPDAARAQPRKAVPRAWVMAWMLEPIAMPRQPEALQGRLGQCCRLGRARVGCAFARRSVSPRSGRATWANASAPRADRVQARVK